MKGKFFIFISQNARLQGERLPCDTHILRVTPGSGHFVTVTDSPDPSMLQTK